jgi:hypothetical protein
MVRAVDSLPLAVSSEVAGIGGNSIHSMRARQRIGRVWLCAAVLCAAGIVRGQEIGAPGGAPVAAVPTGPAVTVHGVVTNAATGAPLARALVQVFGGQMRAALTDGEGKFEFPAMPQGSSAFTVKKPGYGPANSDGDDDMAQFLVRVAEDMADLNLSLAPKNAIYGHVTLSSGMPAQGVGLMLLRRIIEDGRPMWAQAGWHTISLDGSFRFGGLHDGVYMVRSQPQFENDGAGPPSCAAGAPAKVPGYAAVFSNGSADLNSAAQINLSGGQSTELNVALMQTEFHRVQIAVARPPAGEWGISQILYDSSGQQMQYQIRMEKDQMCAYLPDGAYTLMVVAQHRIQLDTVPDTIRNTIEMRRSAAQQGEAGILEFSVDGKPAYQRMALTKAGATPVQVRFSPGPPKPMTNAQGQQFGPPRSQQPIFLTASPVNSMSMQQPAVAVNETEYEIGAMPPGSYWISVVPTRGDVCVGAVTAGGQSLGHTPWVVRGTGTGMPIDVELRTDCAKLTVELSAAPGAENAGQSGVAYVYAIPESDTAENPTATQIVIGATSVMFGPMTPGRYRVYAFASQKHLEFRTPGALDKLGGGQEVTLEPNGTASLMLEGVQP